MEKNQYTKKCHQRGSFVKLSESDMCTTMQYAQEKNKKQITKNDFSRATMEKSRKQNIVLKQKLGCWLHIVKK